MRRQVDSADGGFLVLEDIERGRQVSELEHAPRARARTHQRQPAADFRHVQIHLDHGANPTAVDVGHVAQIEQDSARPGVDQRMDALAQDLIAVIEHQASGQLEKVASTFGVDWPHLGAQIVSFGIVCGILYVLAYKPILQMLEARRQQIASGLANAEKIKAELARIEMSRVEVLAKADAVGKQLIDEARAAAARVQSEETRKATAAAEQIVLRANEAAARDRDRMLAELKQEVGRLVVQTTATVTGKILTPEDHRRLAEETAKQLAS